MATDSLIKAIDQCKQCIDEKISFVLQGGAGSGKTESLKELLIYINQTNPKAKVMCITHTNVAVNEILSRTGNAFPYHKGSVFGSIRRGRRRHIIRGRFCRE